MPKTAQKEEAELERQRLAFHRAVEKGARAMTEGRWSYGEDAFARLREKRAARARACVAASSHA